MTDSQAVEVIRHNIALEEQSLNRCDYVSTGAERFIEAMKIACMNLEKQIPKLAEGRKYGHHVAEYFCPECGKQQKNSFKNRSKGCYCERCGQKLRPFTDVVPKEFKA